MQVKTITAWCLAVFSAAAFADWVSLSGHPSAAGAKFYVDMAQSQKTATGAQLAHLLDLPVAQLNTYGKPYLSERMLVEYDCTKRRARSLTLTQYPGNMGKGDPVATFERGAAWALFTLDPVARTMEEVVCGKKEAEMDVFRAHPGWLDLIQTPGFLNWKHSQTVAVQALAGSAKTSDAILMLDLYKRDQQLGVGAVESGVAAFSRNDREGALKLLRLPAEKGDAMAQAYLGLILGPAYFRGRGVEADPVRSYMWYGAVIESKQVPNDTDYARSQLKSLSIVMSPDQISEARQLLRDCQQRNFKGCD